MIQLVDEVLALNFVQVGQFLRVMKVFEFSFHLDIGTSRIT